jgi:hypothetical protein
VRDHELGLVSGLGVCHSFGHVVGIATGVSAAVAVFSPTAAVHFVAAL